VVTEEKEKKEEKESDTKRIPLIFPFLQTISS